MLKLLDSAFQVFDQHGILPTALFAIASAFFLSGDSLPQFGNFVTQVGDLLAEFLHQLSPFASDRIEIGPVFESLVSREESGQEVQNGLPQQSAPNVLDKNKKTLIS